MKFEKAKNELEKQNSFFGESENMSEEEKQISFLNRYFIYKKVRDIPQATLNNMMELLGEEELKRDAQELELNIRAKEENNQNEKEVDCKKVSSERIILEEEEEEEEEEEITHAD